MSPEDTVSATGDMNTSGGSGTVSDEKVKNDQQESSSQTEDESFEYKEPDTADSKENKIDDATEESKEQEKPEADAPSERRMVKGFLISSVIFIFGIAIIFKTSISLLNFSLSFLIMFSILTVVLCLIWAVRRSRGINKHSFLLSGKH